MKFLNRIRCLYWNYTHNNPKHMLRCDLIILLSRIRERLTGQYQISNENGTFSYVSREEHDRMRDFFISSAKELIRQKQMKSEVHEGV
jgi:hypothetical protein